MKKTRWFAVCMAAMATLALTFAGCSSETDEEPGIEYDKGKWSGDLFIQDGAVRLYRGKAAEVVIPDGVTSIGDYAFYGCRSLESVTIPDGVTSIGQNAFNGCSGLASVTIPDTVTSIGDLAFYGCTSLTSVTIPGSVTSIGEYAFSGCTGLKDVQYTGTLAEWCGIDWGNGYANPLRNSKAVLYFGDEELTVADIPEGVTEIKPYAFYNCKSLTSVTIPAGVTSIGRLAFDECSSLTSVTYKGTKEDWGEIERDSGIFSKDTEITDKDGVTFTVDKDGNITAE